MFSCVVMDMILPSPRPQAADPQITPIHKLSDSPDTRAEIRDAHLTRPVLIDGGLLRLDPLSGTARVSEAQAIRLFRAGSVPSTQVENVMVVYVTDFFTGGAAIWPARTASLEV
jgi:hypothetical protein